MMYLLSNSVLSWELRKEGNDVGWLIGHDAWMKPVKDGFDPMPYALDNGMYFPFGQPHHGHERICDFIGRCGKSLAYHAPLFAVVPDMPYDSAETINRYRLWIDRCREIAPDWRWAIGVQDGMTISDIENLGVGSSLSHGAVCVGGSSEWKESTVGMWSNWCKSNGIWCHVFRVNHWKRLKLCHDFGVDSVDGTGLLRAGKFELERTMLVMRDLKEGKL